MQGGIPIFGHAGIRQKLMKMFRDVRTGMIEDGCNDALAIKAAEYLREKE